MPVETHSIAKRNPEKLYDVEGARHRITPSGSHELEE
jgi:hypothetical protein